MPPYLGVMRSEAPGWHLHFFRRIFEPDGDRFRLICSGICISYTIYVYIYLCIYLLVYLDIYIYIAYIRTYNCVRVYHNTYIYTILMYISTNHWACYFIMVWFHLPMRRRFLRPFYVLRCNGCRSADSRMW